MGKLDIKKEGLSSSNGGGALIPQKLIGMEDKKMKKVVKKGVGSTIATIAAPIALDYVKNKITKKSDKKKGFIAKGKNSKQQYIEFLESGEIGDRLMKSKPKDDGKLKDAMDIIKSNVKIVKKNNKVSKSRLMSELLSVAKADEGSKKMIFGHPFTLKGGKWTPDDGGIPDHKVSKPKSKPTSGGKKDLIDSHPLKPGIKQKLRTPEGTKLLNRFVFNLNNGNKEAARRAHSQLEKFAGNTGAKYNEAQSDYLWNLGDSMSKKK